MSDLLNVTIENGKYTVIQRENGSIEALRYGEPWRDLTGDGMVLALAQELRALKEIHTLYGCPACDTGSGSIGEMTGRIVDGLMMGGMQCNRCHAVAPSLHKGK